jgi:hypothetical protein
MFDMLIVRSLLSLEIPSIYRLERNNHHEEMRDMVEDMAP